VRAVGVDLGGTKISFGVVESDGNLLEEYRLPTPKTWPEMRSLIGDAFNKFTSEHEDIVALGFGAAGLISLDGYAFYSPNVPAFDGGAALYDDLSLDLNIPVFIDNDNNCSAYAESRFGSAAGKNNVLVVGLGTGIGGAYILNGEVLRGAHGFAGELGHFVVQKDGPKCACGKLGCYEALASGSALGRIAREHAQLGKARNIFDMVDDISEINGTHVKLSAINGDEEALKIIDIYAKNVADGLVSLTNIFDPEIIVISGGLVEMGELLLEPVTKYFHLESEGGSNRPLAEIVLAKLGEKAGVVGAGALALSRLV